MDPHDELLSASLAATAVEADTAESSIVLTREVQRYVRNGVVTVDGSAQESQLALRVWCGDQEAFCTYSADIAPSLAARQVLDLAQTLPATHALPPAPPVRIAPTPSASADDVPGLFEHLRTLSILPADGIDIELGASHVTRDVHLRSLAGFDGLRRESWTVISIRVVNRASNVTAQISQEACALSLASAISQVEAEVLPEAVAQARTALHAEGLDATPVGIVIEARVMARLLGLLAPSLLLESAQFGRSRWNDHIGHRVGVPGLCIADDPVAHNGVGTIPFDDEGIPTRRNVLVSDGILRSLLSDRQAATRAGNQSSGSGWRGPAGEVPATRARFLELTGSDGLTSQACHPSGCAAGTLWVQQAHGMHIANDITGNFSFAASGVISDGSAMGRPVRAFSITGNVHEMLREIEGLSRCSHLVKSRSGFLRSPHARIGGLIVAS